MKTAKIIFSPTGGTEKVAKAIGANWPEGEAIDLTAADTDFSKVTFSQNDLVLIAMPSFGGVAPRLALDRLVKIHGNGAMCAVVAVYGNRAYEDTLVQMADQAKQAGFRVIGAVSAVAEHSILHQYAAGRPDASDRKALADFGSQILEKAESGKTAEPAIPGNRPYKKAGAGMVPKATSDCTACGLCAQKCPAGAIPMTDPRKTDKQTCISCMRCVSLCPKNARKVGGFMTAVAGLAIKKACSVRKECELFL